MVAVEVAVAETVSETDGIAVEEAETAAGKATVAADVPAVAPTNRNAKDVYKRQLVFAGYGIIAPEYGKNDFEGIENPRDKVAVVIVNDPGLGSDNTDYFNGDIMTYYGRWMYKFEEGARQGLKGVLIDVYKRQEYNSLF